MITAISPIDGRYSQQTESLQLFFSEYALIKYRVEVEIAYFIFLVENNIGNLSNFDKSKLEQVQKITNNFSIADAEIIKKIERTTNHDVKAVEYYIKEKFDEIGISAFKEFIHFGLTSQDINNTAIPLSIQQAQLQIVNPILQKIIATISDRAKTWNNLPMLARTHGQPASPTTLGKEMYVFVNRLQNQYSALQSIPHTCKFGGATGNFNAHIVAFPNVNWVDFANHFTYTKLGLMRQKYTTQIEHYDAMAARFDCMKRINTILIDFCKDVWAYVSLDYFKQKINENEIGSSAMPHKVNPIDFENAEGNLLIANAHFEFLSSKLPVSRLQRDLTDSTVTRTIGVPYAHSLIAFNSILKGIQKLQVNEQKLHDDLEANWMIVSEGIQTILRRENYPAPYEALKALTRTNKVITAEHIRQFIENLSVSDSVKNELRAITPHNYIGVANNF